MTVKELIEILQTLDPDKIAMVEVGECTESIRVDTEDCDEDSIIIVGRSDY